jgi:hypothetical protein
MEAPDGDQGRTWLRDDVRDRDLQPIKGRGAGDVLSSMGGERLILG